jgi:TP901 family phage tail tape measure protein
MAAFNLTAELNLRGPSNLNQVVGDIRRQLSTVSLDLRIDPRASSNIQAITGNVNNLSRALRSAEANASALNAALNNLGSGISGAANNLGNLNSNINNANNNINNIRNRTREATNEFEAFGRQAGLAVRRFAAFTVVTGSIYAVTRAISSAYSEFVTFNKEFVRLQQVTDQTASGLKGLSQEITRLSQGIGVSSQSLLQVSVTLAQAGLSATETKKALEALAKSALAPSFDNLNDTVEGSIALMRQFGISASELEGALGSINAVAAKFAVEASDIIAAIQRTGGVFASASRGVSEGKDALNEFIAVFTSVRATTRESAETIATGLRTIFSRVQRSSTIQALKEYGVQLTDVEGKFVGAYEAVKRLSDGLSGLDPRDIRFSKIVEELGGFRQVGKVIPLIQQFATAQQALNVAQRGSGSLSKDVATAQEALAVKITKVREEFIALIRDIGQSKGFQTFVDISLKLASALISIADAAKNVLPALTAIVAIRGIGNIGSFVGGLSQSLGGVRGGARGRRGFARGGFVPGSGNGDTVPAMLTPGEFVIRKKAVEAIGVNKLQQMNRYATGGYVQRYAMGSFGGVRSTAGIRRGARSKFKELTPEELNKLSTKDLIAYGKALARDIFTSGGAGMATSMKFMPVAKEKITSELEPYLKTYLGQKGFWQEQISPFGKPLKSGTGKAQSKLSREAALKKQESRMADEVAARAQQWTSIRSGSSIDNYLLSSLKEPVLSDYKTARSGGSLSKTFHNTRLRQEVNKVLDKFDEFDYSGANLDKLISGMAAERFALGGSVRLSGKQLSNTYKSLKNNINPDEIYSANVKAIAVPTMSVLDDMKKRKKRNKGLPNWKNFEYAVANKFGLRSSGGNKFLDYPSLPGEAKFLRPNEGYGRDPETGFIKGNNNETMLAKLVGSGLYSKDKTVAVFYPESVSAFRSLDQTSKDKRNKTTKGYATGGSVEDTVPALLTPGEFVINKRAARKIGYGQLNKLNKADKLQGFNTGGPVGMVQTFAGGGIARALQALESVVNRVTASFNRYGNMRQSVRDLRAQGVGRDERRDIVSRRMMAGNVVRDPMTLLFGAGILGDVVSKAGAPALGAGVAGAAGGAGVGATIAQVAGLTGPLGALATIIPAVVSGYNDWLNALREGIVAENQKKLESESTRLDQAFNNLAKTTKITADSFQEIKGSLSNLQQYAENIRKIRELQATPSTGAQGLGTFIDAIGRIPYAIATGGKTDFTSNIGRMDTVQTLTYGQELYSTAKPVAEATQRAVSEAMKRGGGSLAEAISRVGGNRRDIAIAQGGTRVTDIEAKIKAAETDRTTDAGIKRAQLTTLRSSLAAEIDRLNKEFESQIKTQIKAANSTRAIVESINKFGEAIKNLSASTSRASAEFDKSMSALDINIGTKLGGQVKPVAPNINENVFENLRGYTSQEVASTVATMGSRMGFSSEFTKQATQIIQKQQTLEKDLPGIFARLAAKQRVGAGQEGDTKELKDEISKLLQPLRIVGDDLDTAIQELVDSFNKLTSSGAEITIESLANESAALQKLLQGYGQTTQSLLATAKAYNSVQQELSQRMMEYVNALQIAKESQIQAASIRTQGKTQLQQALNEPISLNDLNAAFDNSIRALTSSTDFRTGTQLTGTTSATDIATRLSETEAERTRLQTKQQQQGLTGQETINLANVTAQAGNLEKALKRLADDSSKASNALAKIQDLQRAKQGRSDTLLDVLSNVNNPEAMTDFILNQQRYSRVMSGRGDVQDLPGAIQALNIAMRGMSSEDQVRTRQRFEQQAVRTLGLDPADLRNLMTALRGPEGEMQDAITQYNAAIENQAKATEAFGKRAEEAGNEIYTKLVSAADEFNKRIAAGTVVPKPEIVVGQGKANGGLIYASRGKYVNFQPKGTDTVPAMLTPGEFVVNAKATKKNLGLLKSINNSSKGYSKGGVVYLAGGGYIKPDGSIGTSVDEEIQKILESIAGFDKYTESLIIQLSNTYPTPISPDKEEELKKRIGRIREERETEKAKEYGTTLENLRNKQNYEISEYRSNQGLSPADKKQIEDKVEQSLPLVIAPSEREAKKKELIDAEEKKLKNAATAYVASKDAADQRNADLIARREAEKTPKEKLAEARKAEMQRRKDAFAAEKQARRQAFLQNNPAVRKQEAREFFRRHRGYEEAIQWWNTIGRWEQGRSADGSYIPDDVEKRYKQSEQYRREQADSTARIAAQSKSDNADYETRKKLNEERVKNANEEMAGRVYFPRLKLDSGVDYKSATPAEIYQDLKNKNKQPSGFESLNDVQKEKTSSYIDKWMSDYEAKLRQEQEEKAKEAANAERKAITERTLGTPEEQAARARQMAQIDAEQRKRQEQVLDNRIKHNLRPIDYGYDNINSLTGSQMDEQRKAGRGPGTPLPFVSPSEFLVERSRKDSEERQRRDDEARSKTNPKTGKPFRDAAEQAGVEAGLAFDAQRRLEQEEAKRKRDFDSGGWKQNPDLVARHQQAMTDLIARFTTDPKFKDYNYNYDITDYVTKRLEDRYANTHPDRFAKITDSELISLGRTAGLDYKPSEAAKAGLNKERERRFNQSVGGRAINAVAGTANVVGAIGTSGAGIIRTAAGIIGLGLGVGVGVGELVAGRKTKYGESIIDSSIAQMNIGLGDTQLAGSRVGNTLFGGSVSMAPVYKAEEERLLRVRKETLDKEAKKTEGLYTISDADAALLARNFEGYTGGMQITPEEAKTLFGPEYVFRGLSNITDVAGAAATDLPVAKGSGRGAAAAGQQVAAGARAAGQQAAAATTAAGKRVAAGIERVADALPTPPSAVSQSPGYQFAQRVAAEQEAAAAAFAKTPEGMRQAALQRLAERANIPQATTPVDFTTGVPSPITARKATGSATVSTQRSAAKTAQEAAERQRAQRYGEQPRYDITEDMGPITSEEYAQYHRLSMRAAGATEGTTTTATIPRKTSARVVTGSLAAGIGVGLSGSAYFADINRQQDTIQFLTEAGVDVPSDARSAEELRKKIEDSRRAVNKYRGGVIYASKGKLIPYSPKGTDTVPAMLTPGEFVINRKAAKQNMGLLKAINNGQTITPKRFNKGGFVKVQYHANDPMVTSPSSSNGGVSSISVDTSSLDTAFSNFQTYVGSFGTEIGKFVDGASKINGLADAISSLGRIDLAGPASVLNLAATSIKDAAGLLQGQIGPFSSSVTELASVISRIPPTITLTAQGSIPVNGSITVILDGESIGELSEANAGKVQNSVFDRIALAINQATAGAINIAQS